MLTDAQKSLILEQLLEKLELPESAYIKAKERYDDLGEWFDRNTSACAEYRPHIFPQGSFRLGTVIRPLDENEAYDLDLSCELQKGISKSSHTQKQLKNIVGNDLKAYRISKGIKSPVEEKHRCWRLEYADGLNFHMDIVPNIPDEENRRKTFYEAMRKAGEKEEIALESSRLAVSITDDRHLGYARICDDWYGSNPEGFARWFVSRMNQSKTLYLEKAKADDLPVYKTKTPLQRAVQLLKRHRDQMFRENPDVKPISIIITTLAARAYEGEMDLGVAMHNILTNMGKYVSESFPRIANPVNPAEDFADAWKRLECRELNLEKNFWSWLAQAQADTETIFHSDAKYIKELAEKRFMVTINAQSLAEKLGISSTITAESAPKIHIISYDPPKPWSSVKKNEQY